MSQSAILAFSLRTAACSFRATRGAGKSALFRATAGLWSNGTGNVRCPHRDKMMFLPQKPYTILGTLRDQMLYGLHDHGISDVRLLEVLRALKFDMIVQRVGGLDAERDWLAALSIGEQQQLAFVKLLLANPHFAFLDQAISSLDPQRGKQLYQILAATSITYLSVGDHVHIQEYHDLVLELSEDGSWETHPTDSAERLRRPNRIQKLVDAEKESNHANSDK
jgi:vitamin B12/bleomycin/antimicrobial peptide transport system ATP-binding/permease protein